MTVAYEKFSPRDKLATARLAARNAYPYFSSALLNLIPREASGLGTLGVTENMLLLWDPEAVDKWPLDELIGTLVHEVGHVLHAHAKRARTLGIIGADGKAIDPRLAKLWNFAGDCAINCNLTETHPALFQEPRVSLLPKQFGLADGLTAEAYYNDLRQQQEQMTKALQKALAEAGDGEDQDDQGQDGSGKAGGAPGRGRCGSCAGNPVAGEPDQNGAAGNEGRSEVEVERIRKEVAEAIKQEAARGRGSVSTGWLRWADAALTPPKVRWQDKLARFCRNAAAWKAGAVDLHHRATSRRQWGIGIGPGRPMLPALRAPVPYIAVVVDTSGSMGDAELTAALRETRGIMMGIGARVTFAACDARVHELRTVTDWRVLPSLLKGGGGTSFIPAFEALERVKQRPGVLVFITDGDGEAPAQAPNWCRVIWLLVGPHKRRPCEWGEHIELTE